jgi:uncharacterized membrane protein
MVAISESLELPRPVRLLRSTGLNLAESFGLPLGGYALATWLWGRDAGVLAMLAAIWITAIARKLATGSVPGLVAISMIVLTVQAIASVATGSLWIFLVHFPLANLGLCLVFAYTARGHSPLAERLAAEVIGLRCRSLRQPRLHRFFQHVTVLWAGIFLLLAACLGALLVEDPTVTYVPIWAAITVVLITAGIGVSTLWLRSVLRKLGIGLCFGPAATAPPAPAPAPAPSPPLAATAGASRSPIPPDGSSGLATCRRPSLWSQLSRRRYASGYRRSRTSAAPRRSRPTGRCHPRSSSTWSGSRYGWPPSAAISWVSRCR